MNDEFLKEVLSVLKEVSSELLNVASNVNGVKIRRLNELKTKLERLDKPAPQKPDGFSDYPTFS